MFAMKKKSPEKQNSPPKKFLVFSAHPDDVDFACAGTVAKLVREGNEIAYCILTNGEKGVHNVKQSKHAMVAMREREQRAAATVVGVEKVTFLHHADGGLENTKNVRREVTKVIREIKPDIIIAHDPGNCRFDSFGRFHRDHRIAAEIVFDAVYPAVGSDGFFPELAREGIFPHQIREMWFYGSDRPDLFFDISETIGLKIEALSRHESQIRNREELPHRLHLRAKEAGKEKKMPCAETFRRLSF